MTVKFNAQAKQIFVDLYNNPEVASKDIHKEITKALHTEGLLSPKDELTAEAVRGAYEILGMEYRKRPRKLKEEIAIEFDDEGEQVSISTTISLEDETEITGPLDDDEDDTQVEWDSTSITREANNF